MKILIVSPVGELGGGAESMLYELVKVLKQKNEIEVLFMQEGKLKESIEKLEVKTILLKNKKMRNVLGLFLWMNKFYKISKDRKPDLILNWMTKAQIFSSIPSYIAGIPICWWQHGVPDPPNILDKLSNILPSNKIGSSSTIAKIAQQKLTNKPVFCSFPGVDIQKHSPNNQNRKEIRKDLGIDDDTIILGNVGRIQSWKRQDLLIEALEFLLKKHYKVKVLLVGGNLYNLDNKYEEKVNQLIEEKNLNQHVITTGNKLDVAPYYDAMDIYVHTAKGEPFGIVMVEAMLHSKPLIAVKSPGSVEIVETGLTGTLLEQESPEMIAIKIEEMIKQGDLKRIGEKGRLRAVQLFSNTQMGVNVNKELEEIINNKTNVRVV